MKNFKFIALISALILCGCGSAKSNVAVVLESGEGTFLDGKTYLILSNVREGTSLNEIEGYATPTKDGDYDFNVWMDDKGNMVEANVKITANAKFTASYIENIEYYRKKYRGQIDEEIQDVLDYALYNQIDGLSYTIKDAMSDVKPMTQVLNDPKITSVELLTQLYQLLHECVQTINQIPSANSQQDRTLLPSYYYQLTQICGKELSEIQRAQSIGQVEALGALARNDLATYRTANRELVNKACEKYRNDVMNATNDIDLAVATQIGGGVIRSSYILETKQEYESVLSAIESKLNEAKQSITNPERLITFIDFLGDCTANYSKIIKSDESTELNAVFEEMYTAALDSFAKLDDLNQQKYQMISSLIKGNAYNLYLEYIRIICDESDLINKISDTIETRQLPFESVKSITSIVTSGAKALDRCNEHSYDPKDFIVKVMSPGIDKYIETPDFLEYVLYAMDVAQNIIPDDVYVKEGGSGFADHYINLNKLITSVDTAYDFYNDNIETVREGNIYEDAFKILVKGIIKSAIYASETVVGLEAGVGAIQTYLLRLIEKTDSSSKSAALGYAYILAGIPTLYTHIGCVLNYKFQDFFNAFDSFFQDPANIETYFGFIKNESDEARVVRIGSTAGLQLGLNFTRFAQPYNASGIPVDDIFSSALADLLKWNQQISKISPAAHTIESFEVLWNAVHETINSSRIRHFAGVDDYENYKKYYLEILREIETVINVIYESTNPEQMINRANIYIDEFLTVLNKWSYGEEEIEIEELGDKVIEDMRKV